MDDDQPFLLCLYHPVLSYYGLYFRKKMLRYLVTGGAGFIGSNYIHYLLNKYGKDVDIINLDKLTYAGNLDNLRDIEDLPNHRFIHGDICDSTLVGELVAKVDIVVNFAAESHVDRSIGAPDDFIKTDIYGAFVLLEAARKWRQAHDTT